MNAIVGNAIVSCYVDAAALLVMVLLLLLSERLRSRRTRSLRLFYLLSCVVTAACVFSFVYDAMYEQTMPWCRTAALIARTLRCFAVLCILQLWLTYVQSKLYGKKDWKSASSRALAAPIVLYAVLFIINLFTGIIFVIGADNRAVLRPLYYVMYIMETVYFGLSAAYVLVFDKKAKKDRFFRITPMILSVLTGLVPILFTPFDTSMLGFSVGLTLLYFSMITELRYVDEESGLYNRSYLAYLYDMALIGKKDVKSALILETDGDREAGFEVLRSSLHEKGDVIRAEAARFFMFSDSDSRSTMQYLTSLVDEAVDKYHKEHPDGKLSITTRCRMRTGDEDVITFLQTVTEEKEAGDTMKGIVSMMSELDRLDKELKLAADIQVNMLPMIFPPFPDRTEFELFASMTPAKEVGGDFYDFFLIDPDHLALVIADVSDKGIPAALFMMVSKTLIKNQLMSGCDPAKALTNVNLQLCERNSSMMFVTVWLAVLEISTGKGLVCNAGHENPCVRRAAGTFEEIRYKHDIVVGISKRAKYNNREFQLSPGDSLFVYTDGVTEATNPALELFGEAHLIETLNLAEAEKPSEVIYFVRSALERFAGGSPQSDDITMLCFKYLG